jgi:hypothetical protein
VLGFRTLDGIEGLNEVHRIEAVDGRIVRVRIYCFCPETLVVVAEALGVAALPRPHRSPAVVTWSMHFSVALQHGGVARAVRRHETQRLNRRSVLACRFSIGQVPISRTLTVCGPASSEPRRVDR